MKSFNTVSMSDILLFLGSSAWALEPSSNRGLWIQEPNYHPAFLASQGHRDLQFCSSNTTCSCALSLPDVTNVTNDVCSYDLTSRCSLTCHGVRNGTDLRIESAAICPDGACEIAATCDNGMECIGPCNALATTVEEYCTPVDCSSSQSESSWLWWTLEFLFIAFAFIGWSQSRDKEADGETEADDEQIEEAEQDSSV